MLMSLKNMYYLYDIDITLLFKQALDSHEQQRIMSVKGMMNEVESFATTLEADLSQLNMF
jgi:hypothetical protein